MAQKQDMIGHLSIGQIDSLIKNRFLDSNASIKPIKSAFSTNQKTINRIYNCKFIFTQPFTTPFKNDRIPTKSEMSVAEKLTQCYARRL